MFKGGENTKNRKIVHLHKKSKILKFSKIFLGIEKISFQPVRQNAQSPFFTSFCVFFYGFPFRRREHSVI